MKETCIVKMLHIISKLMETNWRLRIDRAKMELLRKETHTQENLRVERERLATRNWWQRPAAGATASWVRTGGARATSHTPTTSATARWEPLIDSMLANLVAMDAMRADPMEVDDNLSGEQVTLEREEARTARMEGRDRSSRRDRSARARDQNVGH